MWPNWEEEGTSDFNRTPETPVQPDHFMDGSHKVGVFADNTPQVHIIH